MCDILYTQPIITSKTTFLTKSIDSIIEQYAFSALIVILFSKHLGGNYRSSSPKMANFQYKLYQNQSRPLLSKFVHGNSLLFTDLYKTASVTNCIVYGQIFAKQIRTGQSAKITIIKLERYRWRYHVLKHTDRQILSRNSYGNSQVSN